jgi:hypothetical protein
MTDIVKRNSTFDIIMHARDLTARATAGFDPDDDTALNAWQAELDATEGTVGDKTLARAHVAHGLRSQAADLKELAARILARASAVLGHADRVDEGTLALVLANAEATGKPRLNMPDGGWASAQVYRSESVEVDDASLLAPEFVRFKPAEPNKTAIGIALKAGLPVPGCRLQANESTKLKFSK